MKDCIKHSISFLRKIFPVIFQVFVFVLVEKKTSNRYTVIWVKVSLAFSLYNLVFFQIELLVVHLEVLRCPAMRNMLYVNGLPPSCTSNQQLCHSLVFFDNYACLLMETSIFVMIKEL